VLYVATLETFLIDFILVLCSNMKASPIELYMEEQDRSVVLTQAKSLTLHCAEGFSVSLVQ
jgi:hypothetical protein